MPFRFCFGLPALLLVTACSSNTPSTAPAPSSDASVDANLPSADASPTDDTSVPDAAPPPIDAAAIVADRPYTLHVPASWDGGGPSSPAPLVVMFHGYGTTGATEEIIFRVAAAADAHGFLYAYGNGTVDS